MSPTCNEFTYYSKVQSGRSLMLNTRLKVNFFFANLKIFDVLSIYSLQVSSFMYLQHNDAIPIAFNQIFKSFKLEIRFINIEQDTLTFTGLIPVECFKVLEYGIHYRATSKTPRLLIYSSV